jgi:cytochrome c oxidase assembly protein subunit 15
MRLGSPLWLRRLGWASLVANVGIVLTGGAVRLTSSGLGCPTWPRCTDGSFTPHRALGYHQAIEFSNRTLTFVLTAVAIATLVSAWQSGRRDLRRLAVVLVLSIPAQAVLGGITVLTDLNPWVVSLHLLFSLALISTTVLYLWRIERPAGSLEAEPSVALLSKEGPSSVLWLAWSTYAAAWVVLYLGTVVTGSGPHAGDASAPRNGLDPRQVSQLHADLVFLLVGLTVALVLVVRVTPSTPGQRRTVAVLLAVELSQGVLGFVQYFTNLPIALVELHLLGATLVISSVTWMLLEVREGAPVPESERTEVSSPG